VIGVEAVEPSQVIVTAYWPGATSGTVQDQETRPEPSACRVESAMLIPWPRAPADIEQVLPGVACADTDTPAPGDTVPGAETIVVGWDCASGCGAAAPAGIGADGVCPGVGAGVAAGVGPNAAAGVGVAAGVGAGVAVRADAVPSAWLGDGAAVDSAAGGGDAVGAAAAAGVGGGVVICVGRGGGVACGVGCAVGRGVGSGVLGSSVGATAAAGGGVGAGVAAGCGVACGAGVGAGGVASGRGVAAGVSVGAGVSSVSGDGAASSACRSSVLGLDGGAGDCTTEVGAAVAAVREAAWPAAEVAFVASCDRSATCEVGVSEPVPPSRIRNRVPPNSTTSTAATPASASGGTAGNGPHRDGRPPSTGATGVGARRSAGRSG
jgi:hypothetical protein